MDSDIKDNFHKVYKNLSDNIEPDSSFQELDWESVYDQLPKNSRSKRPVILFWFIGFMALIFIALLASQLNSYKKNNDIDEKVAKKAANSSNALNNAAAPALKSNSLSSAGDSIGYIYIEEEEDISTKKNIITKSISKDDNLTTDQNIYIDLDYPKGFEQIEQKTPIVEGTNKAINLPQRENYTLEKIPQLNPERLSLKKYILMTQNLKLINNDKKIELFGRIEYGKYFEKNHLVHNIADVPSPIMESISSSNDGQQLGLKLLIISNKNYRIGLGINYLRYSFETAHNTNIKASDMIYQSTDSDNIKKYAYQYNTFDGMVNTRVSLSLLEVSPNQNISHLDSFSIDMKLKRRIQNLQIPLVFEKTIFDYNSFSLLGKMGLSMSIFSTVKNSVIHQNENCEQLYLSDNFKPEIVSASTIDVKLSGILGLGFEYKLNPTFTLGLQPEVFIHPNHNRTSWLHQQNIGIYLSTKIK